MNKKLKALYFILIAFSLLYLSFNRHSKYEAFHYRSEIFADKAGYYIYLPALFIYQFHIPDFPVDIDQKTGNGFRLDSINNKVFTKYTYGVALLQFPFFLLAHLITQFTNFEANGFTFLYQKSVDVAAIFYLLTGLFFLFKLLKKSFPTGISAHTILVVFAGTNLFYYAVIETGMSHIYSFCIFSIYLFLWSSRDKYLHQQMKYGFLLGIVAGIIVILRPLNTIFILFSLFLRPSILSRNFIKEYPILIGSFIISGFVMVLPQMFYWNYISESFFYYSYGNEAFSNIHNPQVISVFFAPNSGHILYNPVFLIFVTGIVLMIINKKPNGWIIGTLIVVLSYLISSWWIYNFGCGFANRNFVEYYAILAIPLAYLLNYPKSKSMQIFTYILLLLFSIYSIKMSLSFDGCWYGISNWDWSMYQHWFLNAPS